MQNEKPADLSFACFQGEAWRVCQLSIYRHRGLLSVILYPLRPPYGSPRTGQGDSPRPPTHAGRVGRNKSGLTVLVT
jgi:hypothetical protein